MKRTQWMGQVAHIIGEREVGGAVWEVQDGGCHSGLGQGREDGAAVLHRRIMVRVLALTSRSLM